MEATDSPAPFVDTSALDPQSIRFAATSNGNKVFLGYGVDNPGSICLLLQGPEPIYGTTCSSSPEFTTFIAGIGEFAYGAVDDPAEWMPLTDYLWTRK